MFGKRKTSSLPNIWKNCKKRRKKKAKKPDAVGSTMPGEDASKQDFCEPWKLQLPPDATLDDCLTDDEVSLSQKVLSSCYSEKIYFYLISKIAM